MRVWLVLLLSLSLLTIGCTRSDAPRVAVVTVRSDGLTDQVKAGVRLAKADTQPLRIKHEVVPGAEALPEALARYGDEGYHAVVVVGTAHMEAVRIAAQADPQVRFSLIGAVAPGKNVRSFLFKEQEGTFLAGALAALKSTSGTVGFLGATDLPITQRYRGGFEQGVRYANPSARVVVGYAGETPTTDSVKAKTTELVQRGADVIYAAVPAVTQGAVSTVSGSTPWVIGTDLNQDSLGPAMLGSVVKRYDAAVATALRELADGSWAGGTRTLGLAEQGLTLSGLDPVRSKVARKNTPADLLEHLTSIQQDVATGRIQVADKMAVPKPR